MLRKVVVHFSVADPGFPRRGMGVTNPKDENERIRIERFRSSFIFIFWRGGGRGEY